MRRQTEGTEGVLGEVYRGTDDPTPERERLLNLTADLILDQGLMGLTLSGIARGISSNNRMLLYYFKSKENLVDEASSRAFLRFEKLRTLFLRLGGEGDLLDRLDDAWEDLSAIENQPYLSLYFQWFGIAIRQPSRWRQYLDPATRDWSDDLVTILRLEGMGERKATTMASAIVALWRGLQMVLLVHGDRNQLRLVYQSAIRDLLSDFKETSLNIASEPPTLTITE